MIAPTHPSQFLDHDTRLMLRVVNDDVEAFMELYQSHRPRLIRFLAKCSGDASIAEDLAQQIFLRVYHARKRYTATAKFSTWLFAITRNVLSSARRDIRRRQHGLPGSAIQRESNFIGCIGSSVQPDPLHSIVETEVCQTVQAAIDRLGSRQQEAIRLVCIRGYRLVDAAEEMNATVTMVKQLVFRGKRKLRKFLATDPDLLPLTKQSSPRFETCQDPMDSMAS